MKKVSHNITLKFISITLLSIILLMASAQIASMLKIKSEVSKIQSLWDEVQVEQSEKIRLQNSIRSFLGFGGMIHKLKDSILNGNLNELQSIKSDLQNAKTIIQLYSSFQLSEAEHYALKDILFVIKQYEDNSNKLTSLIHQNTPQHKLDQFMRIDDEPALRGLAILEQNNRNVITQQQSKHNSSSDKFILFTHLVAQLGYGGLIHHIKNYELRAENFYADATQDRIDAIKITLEKYARQALSDNEKKALANISRSIEFYQLKLQYLKNMLSKTELEKFTNLAEIDKSTNNALQHLKQQIDIELQGKTVEVGEKIHLIQYSISRLIKIITIITIFSLLFFAYIMFQKVILPLQRITYSMVLLARQKYNKEITFTEGQVLEVKQMIRSIRIFKKNEKKRRNIAKSLTKMNQTTLQQLAEITALQNKGEQKAEQALSLANHLIELQKRADIDRNNALDNQRRVNMILNTVHDAIITINHQGIIESVNTATELMFGYHESRLIGQNITLLIPEGIKGDLIKVLQTNSKKSETQDSTRSKEQMAKHINGLQFPVEIFLGHSKFNQQITYTAVIRDITQRKKDEHEIQQLILTDPLTNLANRRHFNQQLQRSMENAQRLKLSVGLLIIDLDDFKPVNDTYGHNIGDKVLQLVSSRLEKITRRVDLVARLGGDEFAIILNSAKNNFDSERPAQKVIEAISAAMHIDDQTITIGVTVGIAICPQDALDLEAFINHADKALYKAKSLGKGQYFSYQDLDEDEK